MLPCGALVGQALLNYDPNLYIGSFFVSQVLAEAPVFLVVHRNLVPRWANKEGPQEPFVGLHIGLHIGP